MLSAPPKRYDVRWYVAQCGYMVLFTLATAASDDTFSESFQTEAILSQLPCLLTSNAFIWVYMKESEIALRCSSVKRCHS